MIVDRLLSLLSPDDNCLLLIKDYSHLYTIVDYVELLIQHGFRVMEYSDSEEFYMVYEKEIKCCTDKIALLCKSEMFIPYFLQPYSVILSLKTIFPKLSESVLLGHVEDLDLIDYAYGELMIDLSDSETEQFIKTEVLGSQTLQKYIVAQDRILSAQINQKLNADEWKKIAKKNAILEHYAAIIDYKRDSSEIDSQFLNFLLDYYPDLSSEPDTRAPSILTKTLGFIPKNQKNAIIVIDGMSLFDFEVLRRYLYNVNIEYDSTFAIIPTITSFSRQSLLSGEYPVSLEDPFSTAKERKLFLKKALELGYKESQVYFGKAFEIPDARAQLFTCTILDVDEFMHGEKQGRSGMYGSLSRYGKSGKLSRYLEELVKKGFTIYLTSDHGNAECTGIGYFKSDISIESKTQRFTVLKEFANPNNLVKNHSFKYPGYYLNQKYQYYICKGRESFDVNGTVIITHGGTSLEEVIVPFVKICGDKKC